MKITLEFDALHWEFLTLTAVRRDITISAVVRECVQLTSERLREKDAMAFASSEKCVQLVCEYARVSALDIMSEDRSEIVAQARQLAMWLIHSTTPRGYPAIGKLFSRDQSTVRHACDAVEKRRASDEVFRNDTSGLCEMARPPQEAQPATPAEMAAIRRGTV